MTGSIDIPLFMGQKIYLDAYDFEKDPAVEAQWTQDAEYLHLMGVEPAYPLNPGQVRMQRQRREKDAAADFQFAIRCIPDGRLVGALTLGPVEWSNGNAFIKLGIGSPADRGQGYGGEALKLAMHYAFAELNLFRLTTFLPEYNFIARGMLERDGFGLEVRQRQAIRRQNRTWDLLIFGLLREDWEKRQAGMEAAS